MERYLINKKYVLEIDEDIDSFILMDENKNIIEEGGFDWTWYIDWENDPGEGDWIMLPECNEECWTVKEIWKENDIQIELKEIEELE